MSLLFVSCKLLQINYEQVLQPLVLHFFSFFCKLIKHKIDYIKQIEELALTEKQRKAFNNKLWAFVCKRVSI